MSIQIGAVKHEDSRNWLAYHGIQLDETTWNFEVPCQMLEDGLCTIYEARPKICRSLEIGGPRCLNTIKRRRPLQYLEIIQLTKGGAS